VSLVDIGKCVTWPLVKIMVPMISLRRFSMYQRRYNSTEQESNPTGGPPKDEGFYTTSKPMNLGKSGFPDSHNKEQDYQHYGSDEEGFGNRIHKKEVSYYRDGPDQERNRRY